MDLETISKAIFLLKTSMEKLIITHAMHQQTLQKTRMRDNKSTGNKGKTQERGQRKENERSTNVGYELPGADDKFVLAGVEGQL